MFASVHLTPKPANCSAAPEGSSVADYELVQFASSVSASTSFVRCNRSGADSFVAWTPHGLNGGSSWTDSLIAPPVTDTDLMWVYAAIQARCEAASADLVAPIARLREAAMATFQDDSGLKRFSPITLAVPSYAPGSRVPETERMTYYHSAVRPRAPLSALASTRGAPVDVHVAAAALVLFERVERRLATQHRCVTAHMMHRLLVGCLGLAIKMYGEDDNQLSRALPASVGLQPHEVGRLEVRVLQDLDWSCFIESHEIQHLCVASAKLTV